MAAYAKQLLPRGKAAVCCILPRGIVWMHLEDGSATVYMPLAVQWPLLSPKGRGDKAPYNLETFEVGVRWKVDFQGACQADSGRS